MAKISATIITLNAEATIGATLDSLKWCDEIIVVDSGSTDATIKICEQAKCKITVNPFPGYGQQKNLAAGLAANDWILSIDADEVLNTELQLEIQKIFTNGTLPADGFLIPRTLVFMGRGFKYGEGKKYILRIYNRNKAKFSTPNVHETVVLEGSVQKLNGLMLHYSYTSIHQYLEKFNHYTSDLALGMHQKGKQKSLIALFLRIPFEFFKLYFVKGFILEGYPGFAWASLSSFYTLVKYIKLKELNSKRAL